MTDYIFFQKDKHTIVLESSDLSRASQLTEQGYEKQFEEISASNKDNALARFTDIRRNNKIDRHNFLAGAIAMPLIGLLSAFFGYFFRKK